MPIPTYESLLLPLLRLSGGGHASNLPAAERLLADQLGLSEADRSARLPSGQQSVLRNRIGWASFYLKNAGLLDKPKRGTFVITDRGRQVLESGVTTIDVEFLRQFPEFSSFYNRGREDGISQAIDVALPVEKTPDEVLQQAFGSLQRELAAEVLQKVVACSPEFFEHLVVELLVTMGYGGTRQDAGQRIGKSGDGGIDGIIKEDRLGLDAIYIQAKRWQGTVGRPEIQKFVGALQGHRARKGVFMTTSGYSSEAVDYVSRIDAKVVLLDGQQIATLMIEHNVGVSPANTFIVKKVDSDYFEEE